MVQVEKDFVFGCARECHCGNDFEKQLARNGSRKPWLKRVSSRLLEKLEALYPGCNFVQRSHRSLTIANYGKKILNVLRGKLTSVIIPQ